MNFKNAVLLLFLLPEIASSATYFMSPSGNDSNPGTLSKPWKTLDRLQKAQSTLKPGDIVFFRGGNYVIHDQTIYNAYTLTAKGTASARITYKNYGSEIPVIVGDRRTRYSGGMINLYDYVTVDGLTFKETAGQRLAGGHGDDPAKQHNGRTWTAISAWGKGLVIRNVKIEGWTLGMYWRGDAILFEHNHITNTRSHRLYIAGKNGIFRNNTLDGKYGYYNQLGFQVQYETAIGNKIHNNIIHDGMGGGFVLSGGVSNNQIYNNVFVNPGRVNGNMISLWCEKLPMGIGNKVYNNTFIGSAKKKVIRDDMSSGCQGVRPLSKIEIRDNIFYPSSAIPAGPIQSYANIHNNIFYNISGTLPSGNMLSDPLLVNPLGLTAASAMIKAGSPAIDKGKSLLYPTIDHAGRKRPQGKAYDIGAYEYGTSTTPTVPQNFKISD